ncbi:MAG TPA: hypothetical protein VGH42_06955 [Verrucomicrobiae bacterium]|jgi:hypothetical protein
MKTQSYYLTIIIMFLAIISADSQGIIIQHSGDNNPINEGFTGPSPSALFGPVTGDLGMNAWMIHTTNSAPAYYSQTLTSQQQSETTGANWSLSTTVRLIQSSGAIGVEFIAGSEGGFFLDFGINSNGDPTVQTGNSSPVFTLTGAGSTYNNYELVYSDATDTASLWVNGIQELNDITGDVGYASSGWGLTWGEFQGSSSQANWNLVSLSVPEPSAISLLFLGNGVLIYVRTRKRFNMK